MSTLDTVNYYPDLLITQYVGKAKAYDTMKAIAAPIIMCQTSVQTIVFSAAPASGAFTLSYNGVSTASINWNDSTNTIQTKLRAVTGLSAVDVTGTIAGLTLTVTFTGVTPPAELLVVEANTLNGSISITIEETDLSLPLAVEDAFNLSGDDLAVGDQLDTIGKYVGVSRSSVGINGIITLSDSDYRILIQMGIIRNSRDSSLSGIQQFLYTYFGTEITLTDTTSMVLLYYVAPALFRTDLFQSFLTQGLLPRPMGVGIFLVEYANPYFGMIELDYPPDPDDLLGFSELTLAEALELDTGDTLEMSDGEVLYVTPADPESDTPVEGGGLFSELYEVA